MNAAPQIIRYPDISSTPAGQNFQIQSKLRSALKPMRPPVGRNFGLFASSATGNSLKRFMAHSDIKIPKQKRKPERVANIFEQLRAMGKLKDNWDGFGTAAPNAVAFRAFNDVLLCLHEAALAPNKIEPSVEEGITLSFVDGERYAFLEIYNNGDIAVGYFEGDNEPVAYEFKDTFEQVTQATQKVLEFING